MGSVPEPKCPVTERFSRLLSDLQEFVHDERRAQHDKLRAVWERPLPEKLEKGWTQAFMRLERTDSGRGLWAYLGPGESRFREGDLLCLHTQSPLTQLLGNGLEFEAEEDGRWLLTGKFAAALLAAYRGGLCYADPDGMDLTPFYEQALKEIGSSPVGLSVVLPLLAGQLAIRFDDRDVMQGEQVARAKGMNAEQAQAVGLALGAEQLACIQGPPGTGKTHVLSLAARLMVERGERVLMTSHTHMAINNALNKIHAQGVPTIKVGRDTQRKGLDDAIECHQSLSAWKDRPTNGYVVGATPFATCTARLEGCEFDTVVFDEASQITVPLALMAMRKGKRFIFIGDHKQLPPVLLSRSVLDPQAPSMFAALTAHNTGHDVMLRDTYRMNRWLTAWPSHAYYGNQLVAAEHNRERQLSLHRCPDRLAPVFEPTAAGVFVPTRDPCARTQNFRDAELVGELCAAAVDGGLALDQIAIVTPYRAQGRAVRKVLAQRFGPVDARRVVADTVERMQGQERELIILSLASSDEVFLAAVAPFFFQPERLNVSITRAKSKLIVIGPDLSALPALGDERVQAWLAQYRDFVGQLKRVDLSA